MEADMHGSIRSGVRVLVLGDGDFSFSLSFAQSLTRFHHKISDHSSDANDSKRRCICGDVHLSATSFDSYEAVCEKYTHAHRILAALAAKPVLRSKLHQHAQEEKEEAPQQHCDATVHVTVQHGVDATNVHETLQPPAQQHPFDIVVFNFPHLSTEDARLHSQMLAHIMHSCSDPRVLRIGGLLYITLADSQPQNWRIEAMAQRTRMRVADQLRFFSGAFEGYTSQRHNGRTFRHRVEEAHTFVLHRQEEEPAVRRVVEAILRDYEASIKRQDCALEAEAKVREVTVAAATTTTIDAGVTDDASVQTTKQNRKRKHASDERLAHIQRTEDDKYRCTLCDRTFGTMQGAKTHVHMVHVLQAKERESEAGDGSAGAPAADGGYGCEICGKQCVDAEALQQHTVAKHTGSKIRRSDSSSSQGTSAALNVDGWHECDICGARFDRQEDLDRHGSRGFVPIERDALPCTRCGRQFPDERALTQHSNFCARPQSAEQRTSEEKG